MFRGSLFRCRLRGVLHARFRLPKSARRNQSSTSASIASAMRSEAAPFASSFCSRRSCNTPRSSRLTLALLGGGHRRRQPAEPRLYPDARTKPARTRARDGSLRRPGSDHADDDAQHAVAGAASAPDSEQAEPAVADAEKSPTPNHAERSSIPEIQDIMWLRSRDRDRVARRASPGSKN